MHHPTSHNTSPGRRPRTLLATLRALLPNRPLELTEALHLAERQATELLRLQHIADIPVSVDVVARLPRISVRDDPKLAQHAASGASHWNRTHREWAILVNPYEPRTRQRFTVMHEYHHILSHYHPGLSAYWQQLPLHGLAPAEYLADYFAGCVLMPRNWVKAAYGDGIQRTADLAELFDVSPAAMAVRLTQLGLTSTNQPAARYYRLQEPASQSQRHYHRPLPPLPAIQETAS